MFNRNTYLQFPQGDSNPLSHHASTSVLGDEIFFHHGDVLSGHYLAGGDANPVVDSAAYFNHQGGLINGDPCAMVNSFPRGVAAAAAKKDRHSKIYTSQGPRDRRVRLSIGVARRFFDLQEILGFDKPSKTLDWLLNKSNTAIKDLEQSSKKSAVSSSPSDEVDSADNIGRFSGADSKRKLVEKHKDSSKQASDLVKESRVKARARARERTREKMCIKKLNENISNNGGYDDIPIQYMNNQQLDQFCHPTSYEDLIQQESILIKRKVKQYPGFQHQNLFISSSNDAVPSPADNWDISTNFASQSNICAILDQHKFFNSTSNN